MRYRLPKLRLDLALAMGCRRCGSKRRVRAGVGLCEACRPKTRLDRWCEARAVTLSELAARAKVSRATIAKVVAGDKVGERTLVKLWRVTGIAPDQIQEVQRGRR